MPQIEFPTSTAPAEKPEESGGRLINCYAEKLETSARAQYVWRRVPGLLSRLTASYGNCRGMLEVDGELYYIGAEGACYVTYSSGSFSIADLGAVAGTDNFTMARNNKSPTPDVLAVGADGAFSLTTSSVAAFSDPDLPTSVGVTYGGGYFFFPIADGRCFASGINDVTVDALDVTTADARPDGLKRAVYYGERLLLFGSGSTQAYNNTGNATGFPFSAGAVINRGLAGTYALAGFEAGWVDALIWVGDDNRVYTLNGNQLQPISTPHIERMIEAVDDKETLEALVYMHGGHAKWSLSCASWTLEFDVTTGSWNERHSYGRARWIASKSAKAFGEWLVGSYDGATVYAISDLAYREGQQLIPMTLQSGPQHDFPARLTIPEAHFDVATGYGLAAGLEPIQTDPMIDISWSDDGGVMFGYPVRRSLGAQGEYGSKVAVYRTGQTKNKGRVWRIECADPIDLSIFGGTFRYSAGAAA